jgi:hypothetical protein
LGFRIVAWRFVAVSFRDLGAFAASSSAASVNAMGRVVGVDPDTVCFGVADDASDRDCTQRARVGDVNRDGRADLLFLFETQQTGIDAGDTQACLNGKTVDQTLIEGCDTITTH